MKKGMERIGFVVCLLAVLFLVSNAHAALELRGEGTSTYGTHRLIYDTDFNITWYDYTKSAATWQNQMNWASALSVSGGDLVGVYDDWRLPTALNQNGSGPCGPAYNCTGSEMGHLYFTELGNIAYPSTGWGLNKTGDFQNLQLNYYSSGTEDTANTTLAGVFGTLDGFQGPTSKDSGYLALAVRAGDVAVVPEPISSILFVTGGALMAGRRYLKRKIA